VIKVFQDASHTALLGEHHEFITYYNDLPLVTKEHPHHEINRSQVFQPDTFWKK